MLAAVQGYFIATWLEGQSGGSAQIVTDPGLGFRMMTIITLTTGTAFIMWLGEQITEKGIGNGSSMIIFAGIVAGMWNAVVQFFGGVGSNDLGNFAVVLIALLIVGTIAAICFFERAQRRIPVQYTKRQVGRKMYSGAQTFLPLKINVSGVIPPIFASSLLMFPQQLAQMSNSAWLNEAASVLTRPTGAITSSTLGSSSSLPTSIRRSSSTRWTWPTT
jgi:preprotein translocase subunit SecY